LVDAMKLLDEGFVVEFIILNHGVASWMWDHPNKERRMWILSFASKRAAPEGFRSLRSWVGRIGSKSCLGFVVQVAHTIEESKLESMTNKKLIEQLGVDRPDSSLERFNYPPPLHPITEVRFSTGSRARRGLFIGGKKQWRNLHCEFH
jgi:hypothetical protein